MRRFLSIVLAVGLILSFSLVTAVPAQGDTFDVPGDYPTIQSALTAAVFGDIIYVAADTYYENITLKNGVKVMGAGAGVTIIDGDGISGPMVSANSIDSATTIDGFTIRDGIANFGGGMYNIDSSPTVSNCIFTGNEAANFGGGMYNFTGSSPVVVNCIFTSNTAGSRGGGIYADDTSSPTITNCTIAYNTASNGGGIYTSGSLPTITNNIIASNTATTGGGIYCATSTPVFDYNDVYGNTVGNYGGIVPPVVNNISLDPLFEDPGPPEHDYHLQAGSNCIDMGSNGAPFLPATDFEGEPRIYPAGGTVDIGADEYYVPPPPPPPSRTVGGEVYPIDKAAILLPWLGLGAFLILAAGGLILVRRRSR